MKKITKRAVNVQKSTPRHVAIIMDGNRRWAHERGLPALEGHRRVANSVLERLIEHAADRGIAYLTFWAFSTENWTRSTLEVKGIMMLLRQGFKRFGLRMHKKGIRIRMIGDITRFDADIQKSLTHLIDLTQRNSRITVVFALNYGGRDEMLRAMKKIADPPKITEEMFSDLLDTAGVPDPEFIIRTGGEQRLSGFLLWQSEYSELYFPVWYMPEFTPKKLDEALGVFTKRKRRFGK